MIARFRVAILLAVVCASLTGCGFNPFRRCDNRPSLADWLDENGPLGCNCRNGHCHNCNNGRYYR
jgi:hypothetical protein